MLAGSADIKKGCKTINRTAEFVRHHAEKE
jgi:hypothetical protein